MSANKNPDAMYSQGEFHSRVPPSEPLTTKGHKPGVKVGNDALPEFHAETHPPETAPREATFKPQPVGEIPGQAQNPSMTAGTVASETLPGASSSDVYQGLGHPGGGMTSQELHGRHKKERSGLEEVGASYNDPKHAHQHDRPYETGTRGKATEEYPAAEDYRGATAEDVAAERRQ